MDRTILVRLSEELRKRLIIITVVVFTGAMISFAFSDKIRNLLLRPGEMTFGGLGTQGLDLQLIFLTPSEALMANIRLAFITSATLALPIILYNLLALAVAVAGLSKKSALFLTAVMYILFAGGLSFAYFVVLPFALNFFVGFSGPDLVPSFSIARYISFATSFMFYFGLVFQLPVLFWFLGALGLVNARFLRSNRKYAFLAVVLFAAVLTPPDPFSQVLMAIPLMGLFELGIVMVYLAEKKRNRASLESDRL